MDPGADCSGSITDRIRLHFLEREWVFLPGLAQFSDLSVKLPSSLECRPLSALPSLQFRKETVKRLLPFRAWEGAAALCFRVAASREGWKVRTFLLSSIGAESLRASGGEGEDRREACSSGVFFFLQFLARVRVRSPRVIPVVWLLWTRGGEAPSQPVARGRRLRGTSPEKRCPASFPKSRQLCSPGRHAGARDPRHPPLRAPLPFAQALREDRVSACACPAPRSVQLFHLGDPGGSGRNAAWAPRLGERPAGSLIPQRPALWTTRRPGAGTHLPRAHGVAGAFLRWMCSGNVWVWGADG